MSDYQKMRISQGTKGRIVTQETRLKIGLANKGKIRSETFKSYLSAINSGENHYNWKGGVSQDKEYISRQRKEYRKKWLSNPINYKKTLWRNRRRKVIKRGVGGSHTFVEWEALKMKYRYMCLCCKRCEPEITLSKDHVLPLSKGGTDDISNIQPLCYVCNSKKYVKSIDYRQIGDILNK